MLLCLVACVPAASDSASLTDTPQPHNAERITATLGVVEIAVNCPSGWQAYTDDEGLALAENPGSVADGSALRGVLLYLWMPPLDEFNIPADSSDNRAQLMLDEAIRNPIVVGSGRVTVPQGFAWGDQDAAYYLLNDSADEGHATLVLAVTVPRSSRLLAVSVSAPHREQARIREMLPTLLDGLTLNRVPMNSAALDTLPQTLAFPE
ncbi:MAG: hypothetical protein U0694_26670 [Anaerolineae bacterium]